MLGKEDHIETYKSTNTDVDEKALFILKLILCRVKFNFSISHLDLIFDISLSAMEFAT